MTLPTLNIPDPAADFKSDPVRRFFEALDARAPRLGTAEFSAGTSITVPLAPAMPDADYHVDIDGGEDNTFWVAPGDKATDEFIIRAASSTSAVVGWKITRR